MNARLSVILCVLSITTATRAEKISLVGDGPFYTPLVQTLLAEKRYRDLKTRVVRDAKPPEALAVNY